MTDCPKCDAAGTLEEAGRLSPTGAIRYVYCTCCGQVSVIDADGRPVPNVEKDVTGRVIDGP